MEEFTIQGRLPTVQYHWLLITIFVATIQSKVGCEGK